MRKLLAIAAFLLCAALTAQAQTGVTTVGPVTINGGATLGGAPAASFSPVFSTAGNCFTGTVSCTVTLSVTAGQFVVCGEGSTATSITLTCSDSDGDTITSSPSSNPYTNSGAAWTLGLKYGSLTHTNASEVFTCTASSSEFTLACAIGVYSGTPTSGWDVALAGNSQNGFGSGNTTLNSGTTTTTANASELAIGFFMVNTSAYLGISQSGSWNLRTSNANNVGFAFVDLTLTTTGTYTAALLVNETSLGNNAAGIISTIK
jgi:hypothetical protein